MVDSVSTTYNKYQSVNFLIDQSATVGAGNFAHMTAFLNNYIAMTNDDPAIISISYYDLNLQSSIDYNPANTKVNIMVTNSAKACRCSGNSNLGASLNSTIAKIQANNFNSGISKIIVAIVGTTSLDDVQFAS